MTYVTQGQLTEALLTLYDHVLERIDAVSTSEQDQINAITAELGTVQTDLQKLSSDISTAQSTLQAEIDKLASQTPSVDVSGLQAAADALDPAVQSADAAVQALGNLQPTPPAPPTP